MGKNIILCCDGTGQKFQENKTNPLRLHYCLRNDKNQISFYDPGVGTFDPDQVKRYDEGWFGNLKKWAGSEIEGEGFGYGIVRNIVDGYRFLMQTYDDTATDKVFIFGFSRGAFTAQALAGMLNKCGLVYPYNENLLSYVADIYLARDNDKIAKDFKATMARECRPHFVGVWDTVQSLGHNHKDDYFYDHPANNSDFGFQALSIDEKRSDFVPNVWDIDEHDNLEQVWFSGVHSDIGGGYPEDGLANISLRFMIERARERGVQFHDERIAEFEPNPDGKLHESYKGWIKIRGKTARTIDPKSCVHANALERRHQHYDSYNPTNLPEDTNLRSIATPELPARQGI